MNRLRVLVFFGALTALLWGSAGCELIATVDRPTLEGGGGTGGSTPTGGGGTGGSAPTGGGGTGGMPCDPADCPAPESECVDAICNPDGTCGEAPKADGTPAQTQTDGDCKQKVCQAGAAVDIDDDADLPDDGNDCTDDVCAAGVSSNPFLPVDSPCGADGLSFCDGAGTCSECTNPAQCPGSDTECQTRTCDDGVCGVSNAAAGTPVASQITGDCLENVCDGDGGIEAAPDDLDVADDGNDCTENTCDGGMNVTTDAALDTPCGAGGTLYCNGAGVCVGCTDASQCGDPGNECLTAACAGGQCGAVNKADGTPCDDGDACSQTDTCQSGACTGADPVTCSALDQCHDAGTCDPGTGMCSSPTKADGTSCDDGDACTQADACQAGICAAGNPVSCPFGGMCSGGACSFLIDYIKASSTGASDNFGVRVALSADGNTLAVGAWGEGSAATGVGGNQANDSAPDAGAVYVFTRSGGAWVQQAYIKASNTGASDNFGISVALSADGNTLAVGASGEDSAAGGVGGNQASNSAPDAGAVYVFTRSGAAWSQQAYIKATNTGADDVFGTKVALSADGNTLAVGAWGEDSNATGVGGNQADNSASGSGAVYVLARSGAVWSHQAYIKASNTGVNDNFGIAVALSADGNTLAVGALGEDSNATGVDGDQADNSASGSGAVYVFTKSGGVWSQQAYVKASNTGMADRFGISVALSSDGNTLAAGAYGESSNATGVGGNQADDSAASAGAVYVLVRSGVLWSQEAYVKASNTGSGHQLGGSVALASNGSTLAVGAIGESSSATGVGGDQANSSAPFSGAVYMLTRSGGVWSQQAYVKASNTDAYDTFGGSVALSSDGGTLAVGASSEASNATGINGNQADNSAPFSGAVYVY